MIVSDFLMVGEKRASEMVTLTRELIKAGGNGASGAGFTWAQLEALGVPKPYTNNRGWLDSLVGKKITREQYQLFLNLRGVKRPRKRK